MKSTDTIISLSPEEILQQLVRSLGALEKLCSLYDGGHTEAAFMMSTELIKLFESGAHSKKFIAKRLFPTVVLSDVIKPIPGNQSTENNLVSVEMRQAPPGLYFIPNFKIQMFEPRFIRFQVWWEKDIVHRASAAPPGSSQHHIFQNPVPYEKRRTLTRRELVRLVRNKIGSHIDPNIPETLRNIQSQYGLGVGYHLNELHTIDGSLPMIVSPVEAMMRQIGHEVMVAFGRLLLAT